MKLFGKLILLFALLSCLVFPVFAEAPAVPPLEDAILEACTYGKDLMLTDYGLSSTEFEAIYKKMYNEGRLPWYVSIEINYGYNRLTQTAIVFYPTLLDPEVYNRDLYEQKTAEVLAECVFPGMTDWQIALSLHDYLITHTTYDSSLEADTAYDLLVHGTSTCAGYADAYKDLMNRAGVPCYRVSSMPMEHAWNLVQIDGEWYHADLTWDDPTPNTQGYARHTNFLISDQDISEAENPHHGWETDITCTSNRFRDAFWQDVTTPVIYESSDVCYFLRYIELENALCRRTESTESEQILYTHEMVTLQGKENRYTVRHGGLSLRNGRLYFATLDGAVSVDTQGGDLRREFDFDTGDGSFTQGCFAGAEELVITISNLDNTPRDESVSLPAFESHVHSYQATPIAATCTEPGGQLYTCDCGISYRGGMTEPAGHRLVREEGRIATFFNSGYTTGKCSVCGLTETQTTPRVDFFLWFREDALIPFAILCGILIFWGCIPSKKKKAAKIPEEDREQML